MRTIANNPRDFYTGDIAKDIVQQVQQTPRAGSLSLQDMRDYQALKKSALCTSVGDLQLCGPPPSSSWVAVGAMLGLLEFTPEFSTRADKDPKNWTLFAEAQRLAYADRDPVSYTHLTLPTIYSV